MPMKNRIKHLVDEYAGGSARAFAAMLGMREATVYELKNDPSIFPSGATFERIIRICNVSPSDIVEYVADE